jgi:nucleoside-diphosphate-sugar epimerase
MDRPPPLDTLGVQETRMTNLDEKRTILLTGASGYIGGRLLPRLEARDIRLRCMARTPDHLTPRVARRHRGRAG